MIKLNWTSGKNLGLSLIYIGIMGLVQVIFILIAQFAMGVGSIYAVMLMPIGAIIATFYSVVIIFESQMNVTTYRSRKTKVQGRKPAGGKFSNLPVFNVLLTNPYVKPVTYTITAFVVFFLLSMGFASLFVETPTSLYLIGLNGGSLGSLFVATYYETKMKRKGRR